MDARLARGRCRGARQSQLWQAGPLGPRRALGGGPRVKFGRLAAMCGAAGPVAPGAFLTNKRPWWTYAFVCHPPEGAASPYSLRRTWLPRRRGGGGGGGGAGG